MEDAAGGDAAVHELAAFASPYAVPEVRATPDRLVYGVEAVAGSAIELSITYQQLPLPFAWAARMIPFPSEAIATLTCTGEDPLVTAPVAKERFGSANARVADITAAGVVYVGLVMRLYYWPFC